MASDPGRESLDLHLRPLIRWQCSEPLELLKELIPL
jgi:hypothetical protein